MSHLFFFFCCDNIGNLHNPKNGHAHSKFVSSESVLIKSAFSTVIETTVIFDYQTEFIVTEQGS